jgi:hypothetical protein
MIQTLPAPPVRGRAAPLRAQLAPDRPIGYRDPLPCGLSELSARVKARANHTNLGPIRIRGIRYDAWNLNAFDECRELERLEEGPGRRLLLVWRPRSGVAAGKWTCSCRLWPLTLDCDHLRALAAAGWIRGFVAFLQLPDGEVSP